MWRRTNELWSVELPRAQQPPPIPAPASEPRQRSTAIFRANSLRNAAEAASG